jgi:ABC-2 type transport system ATP-binding protein
MSELSLGTKKKVAIIQAIITKPKLLILDEPTNGLDQ